MLKKIVLVFFCFVKLSLASDLPVLSGVGGDFSAVDTNGQAIKLSTYEGNIVVLAFGYTNCADICPFTLGYLKNLYGKLSPAEQKNIRIVFVTIDPEYDTPEHLKAFIGYFNKNFIGLSGTRKQIDYAVSLFQAKYQSLSEAPVATEDMRRVTPKEGIDTQEDKALLFTHSVTIYLLDKQLRVRSLEYTGTPASEFIDKIKTLMTE